ncbi:MAG: aminotransferase class V-fold PLP-dependent enzyme [Planctomycetota bacterium]
MYLDNAATTWPKPDVVWRAMDRYQRENGAAAGRGAYRHALDAQRIVMEARRGVARLLNASDPRRVVWTANCTDALNLALHGYLRPGCHVVTTENEHNSVLRPLRWWSDRYGVRVCFAPVDAAGFVRPASLASLIRDDTRLVVVNHASNVTGALQPLGELAAIVAAQGRAALLVDAAQTLGQVPWELDSDSRLLIAAAGHKGLLGPLGIGLLYIGPGLESELLPVRQGGSGTDSERATPPDSLPERFEAGNLNVPALAGLLAGMDFIERHGVPSIAAHHRELGNLLRAGLAAIPGVRVLGPAVDSPSVGVVSCVVESFEPHELAAVLDAEFGIEARAGLHCAPRIHAALGTQELGGAIRFSVGFATTPFEMEATVSAIRTIVGG